MQQLLLLRLAILVLYDLLFMAVKETFSPQITNSSAESLLNRVLTVHL